MNEANSPVTTNSSSLIRLTRIPAKYAASSWAPIANSARPRPVACSTIAVSTARTANSRTGYVRKVPGTVVVSTAQSAYFCGKPVTASLPSATEASPR